MTHQAESVETCLIIGASHAGVNFAFSLRREGWEGEIVLYDTDPELPYHRPPLSKAYLSSAADKAKQTLLRPATTYEKQAIELQLGQTVTQIDRENQHIQLADGTKRAYTKLVLATGGRAILPPIEGLAQCPQVFPLRTAEDAHRIRTAFENCQQKRVVVIGGGYIGLETAASLRQQGAKVTVLEKEARLLARVTSPEISDFFAQLHQERGVEIQTDQEVTSIQAQANEYTVHCRSGAHYPADLIVVGVGIHVNQELAVEAGLAVGDGIVVDETARTNDSHIYAIGDCTWHHNPHYDRYLRLESVQNATEQAKTAAMAIMGKEVVYDSIPWFWSDQFDIKLQIVGLSDGYDTVVVREEKGDKFQRSVWYFQGERLLAVDALNHPKAYMLGMRFLKNNQHPDLTKLADPETKLHPNELISA